MIENSKSDSYKKLGCCRETASELSIVNCQMTVVKCEISG